MPMTIIAATKMTNGHAAGTDDPDLLRAQLNMAKMLCRQLWRILRAETQKKALDHLDYDGRLIVDAAFEAAQAVWDRHHIFIQPLEPAYDERFLGLANEERYLAVYPGGAKRIIPRETLLTMGGVHNPDLLEIKPKDGGRSER